MNSLSTSECAVDIWTVPLVSPAPEHPSLAHLSADELARANRFKFEKDRFRWIRARSALRLILAGYAGDHPANLCFTYGEHGKPALPAFAELNFNLSHAGDWAMIAVTQSVPVGVDIERIRPEIEMADLLERLGENNLPVTTEDLYRRWTGREARSKAAGAGLFDKPAENIVVMDLSAPSGYAASVALVGHQPVVRYCGAGSR
jgi:4'-phosphopantetheinyl transferase